MHMYIHTDELLIHVLHSYTRLIRFFMLIFALLRVRQVLIFVVLTANTIDMDVS